MLRILLALTVVLGAFALAQVPAMASSDDEPEPVTTEVPVVTANPFLPEEVDLTSCIGMLQRPGCGSEERGGWHQYLVAGALAAGLLIVFGRVAWSVRQSQKRTADSSSD